MSEKHDVSDITLELSAHITGRPQVQMMLQHQYLILHKHKDKHTKKIKCLNVSSKCSHSHTKVHMNG